MEEQKCTKHKNKCIQLKHKLLGDKKYNNNNNNNGYDENMYKKFLMSNIDLINVDIKFPCYFIQFTNQIEYTLNEYIKKNKLKKLYVLCTSHVSSIIGTYFELLSKCKHCKFMNLADFNDKIDNNMTFDIMLKNYTCIVIMEYISQGSKISYITKILNNLELNNNKNISNNFYGLNNQIIEKIKKEIKMDRNFNTDPINDNEFDPKNKYELNSNFLNLYDFVNISSISVLNKYKKNKNMQNKNTLIKLLVLTYIYNDIYQNIYSTIKNLHS